MQRVIIPESDDTPEIEEGFGGDLGASRKENTNSNVKSQSQRTSRELATPIECNNNYNIVH